MQDSRCSGMSRETSCSSAHLRTEQLLQFQFGQRSLRSLPPQDGNPTGLGEPHTMPTNNLLAPQQV